VLDLSVFLDWRDDEPLSRQCLEGPFMEFTKALVWAETGATFATPTSDCEMNAARLRSAVDEPALPETRDSSGVFREQPGDGSYGEKYV
jgi:hypothetical protein